MKFKVYVWCATYNQSEYIVDTMDGFVMQQTNFPFVCCIVDDASTDGEQKIIQDYLDAYFDLSEKSVGYKRETDYAHIIFAQHKKNKNCYFAVLFLKENLYSKHQSAKKRLYISEWRDNSEYEAICEGDDFWICSNKLQIEVDFMDQHQDYGLVHTDFDLVKGNRNHKVHEHKDGNYWPYSLTEGLSIGTLTTLIRMSVFDIIPEFYLTEKWPMGDKPLWIEISRYFKIHYIPMVTAKYRVLENSASHGNIEKLISFLDASEDITTFYAQKFGVSVRDRWTKVYYYENLMKYAYRFSDSESAAKFFKFALKNKCASFKLFVFYLGAKYVSLRRIISKFGGN